MATYQLIGKKWQARIRKSGLPSTSANFDTKAEAKSWATTTEAQMIANKHKDQRSIKHLTLGMLVDKHFEKEPALKKYGKNKVAVLNRLKRELGEVRLPSLDFHRLTAFVDSRSKDGAGGLTIGMDVSQIAALLTFGKKSFKYPVDLEVIYDVRDYMNTVGLEAKSSERSRRPTETELQIIKEHFDMKKRQKIPMSKIIDFAVATTMRASEITSLRWSDVNFEKRTVIIRDRKHPSRKTGNHQEVAVLPDAWSILSSQPRIESEDRIFPYQAKTFSSIFPRAVHACGIEDLHFHDLRHEGTSRLFEQGYDIPRVAMFTGHSDWKMLRRYVQLRPEDLHPDENGNLRQVRSFQGSRPQSNAF